MDNNLEAVENFLSKGLDPEANEMSPAIDAAWNKYLSIDNNQKEKNNCVKIMKTLLNVNSRFPTTNNWFETNNVPDEIVDFLKKCENLHALVDQDNFETFGEEIKKDENLIFYYNRNNESVIVHGLKVKKYKIINYIQEGLSIGIHEDLNKDYDEVEIERQREIFTINFENAKDIFDVHLFNLKAKSKIVGSCGNNRKIVSQRINEAFDTIDTNKYCSKILKLFGKRNF